MKLLGQFYVLLHLDVKDQQQMEGKNPHARCEGENGVVTGEITCLQRIVDLRSGVGGAAVIPSTFSERGGKSMVLCIFPVFRYKINHPVFSSGFRTSN